MEPEGTNKPHKFWPKFHPPLDSCLSFSSRNLQQKRCSLEFRTMRLIDLVICCFSFILQGKNSEAKSFQSASFGFFARAFTVCENKSGQRTLAWLVSERPGRRRVGRSETRKDKRHVDRPMGMSMIVFLKQSYVNHQRSSNTEKTLANRMTRQSVSVSVSGHCSIWYNGSLNEVARGGGYSWAQQLLLTKADLATVSSNVLSTSTRPTLSSWYSTFP